jgi:hypothetical protein
MQGMRMPPPPAQDWKGLWLIPGLMLVAGFGMCGGAGLTDESLLALGGVIVGITGVGIALLLVVGGGSRPGRTLAFAPAPLGQPFQLGFVAERAKYHGLWVNFDIDWDLRSAPHGFVIEIEPIGGERAQRFFQSFSQPPFNTKSVSSRSGVSTGFSAPDGFRAIDREVDVTLESRADASGHWRGRLQTYSCLVELRNLPPNQQLAVRGVIRPFNDAQVHHFHAEVFVALPG